MTERRWRSCKKLVTAAALLLLLAGLSAAAAADDHDDDASSEVKEEKDGGANSTVAGDAERERRQAYHQRLQAYRPYSDLSAHTPTAPYSIFAARPTFFNTQASSAHALGGVPASPLLPEVKPSFYKPSVKPTVTKVPPSHKYVQRYSPSRTPAAARLPFLHPGHHKKVTPVPHHLRPVQPPTHTYGAAPAYPGPGECPDGLQCVPLVSCAPCYHQVENHPQLSCSIYGGAVGVCCPGQPNNSGSRELTRAPKVRPAGPGFTTEVRLLALSFTIDVRVPELPFPTGDIHEAAWAGLEALAARDILEKDLQEAVEVMEAPSYAHLQQFKTSSVALRLSRDAFVHLMAANYLLRKSGVTGPQAEEDLQEVTLANTVIAATCPRPPRCSQHLLYRTLDGSCNNLEHPSWGQARTTYQRLRPPHYSDGLSGPRVSVGGGPLPSARLVSTSIAADEDRPSADLTLSVMQWGQFLDHDLAHTPINRFGDMGGIQCCGESGRDLGDATGRHPACFPIHIPADDPFFGGSGRRCMNFVRSLLAPRTDPCTLGHGEQMNQVTHYLDGSNIYGSSRQDARRLRRFRGGLLVVQERDLLPPDPSVTECQSTSHENSCFKAGDGRVNQQIELAIIHTVWVRMHNRIARELARLNPHWSDETIFQEARRIVVAIYQHIIYNEWLPLVIGKDYMAENGLLPLRHGYSRDYDGGLSAAILNEFATVAFRFGHTLVQGMIQLVGKKGMKDGGTLLLHDNFNNPRHIYTPGRLDQFLRGLATQPIQQFDNFVTTSLTNRLFQTPQMPFGMDLVALNTQRGRDHGIAPYNELREACGLPRARTFEDLLDVVRPEVVNVFQQLYASVDDIDPFVAGISERPAPGALLGPTFRCIVGDQFIRLKRGDRFFYDLADMPASFSKAQLYSIRMMSWARVLCETGDMLGYVQPLAFRQPRGLNERIPCDSPGIPGLDLSPWTSRAE